VPWAFATDSPSEPQPNHARVQKRRHDHQRAGSNQLAIGAVGVDRRRRLADLRPSTITSIRSKAAGPLLVQYAGDRGSQGRGLDGADSGNMTQLLARLMAASSSTTSPTCWTSS
jgi:hypothetical protein